MFLNIIGFKERYLHTPTAFFIMAVGAALIATGSPIAGVVAGVCTILLCFPIRISVIVVIIYISSIYTISHSTFVLDREYRSSGTTLITTKGRLKGIDAREGDLLWGSPEADYSIWRVFPISNILSARVHEAAYLFNQSGGRIATTPAHIYGVRSYISQKQNDEYIITGLTHLLSISGAHVAIFLAGFFIFLPFIPRKVRAVPAILLLPLLIPLSGFAVTVVRAVLFSMVFLIAWVADLKVRSLNFLITLAAAILLLSPNSLYSISFQLSFGAVFGIIMLVQRRYSPAVSIVAIGIASTVFTLPLQLYLFGTSNLLSIVTTVILTPFIWLQMLMGMISIALPSIMIEPLATLEGVLNYIMEWMARVSWHTLYIAKPPTALLIVGGVVAIAINFTRFRLISILILLLPLMPVYPNNILIFPELPPSQKGYILSSPKGNEIFFQGMYSSFLYRMLPEAAKLGVKTFDTGNIRIFDGENRYIKIEEAGKFSGVVCVNDDSDCDYHFSTRSNSLKAPLPEGVKSFIIYRSELTDPRILQQSELREIEIEIEVQQ
ncbi:MAG: ComEC/Rec2 family competence protein [Deferribacteraceae bacterium]|jgi:competence protein ComEC|nr:ComEC/Rec2 family competence protein [Deferribacteraceae bacterium]